MISVIKAASQLIQNDEIALEAMRAGQLNLSGYADSIHEQIEEMTFKDVKKGTIVVALSRLSKEQSKLTPPLKPVIKLDSIEVKSGLTILSFDKTQNLKRKMATLNPFHISEDDLFSLTEGPSELSIVCTKSGRDKIVRYVEEAPKAVQEGLVAVTIRFESLQKEQPNFYYALLFKLASKRIIIHKIISTSSQISFIVDEGNMEETVSALNPKPSK